MSLRRVLLLLVRIMRRRGISGIDSGCVGRVFLSSGLIHDVTNIEDLSNFFGVTYCKLIPWFELNILIPLMPFFGDFSLPILHATLYATNQRNGTDDTTDSNHYLFNE